MPNLLSHSSDNIDRREDLSSDVGEGTKTLAEADPNMGDAMKATPVLTQIYPLGNDG